MSFNIQIELDQQSPIMQVLHHLGHLDKTAMFSEIGAEVLASTQQRFIDQKDVQGNPWKQSWRAKLQNGQTLRDTGRLLNSFTYNVSSNGVEIGTDVIYAPVLHYGMKVLPKTAKYLVFNVGGQVRKVKEVNIPARSFLGIDQKDEENILNIIGKHLNV